MIAESAKPTIMLRITTIYKKSTGFATRKRLNHDWHNNNAYLHKIKSNLRGHRISLKRRSPVIMSLASFVSSNTTKTTRMRVFKLLKQDCGTISSNYVFCIFDRFQKKCTTMTKKTRTRVFHTIKTTLWGQRRSSVHSGFSIFCQPKND